MNATEQMKADIRKMSDEKLIQEIKEINWHIEGISVGKYELWYQNQLYAEKERRGL